MRIMRSTFSILFYINRGKIKADGTTAVMCRITIDGRNTACIILIKDRCVFMTIMICIECVPTICTSEIRACRKKSG